MPKLPDPSLTLSDIDKAFNRPDVRPAEMGWRRLDPGSYAVQLPGMAEDVRATTSEEVFDDHAESHVFLSPGSAMFDRIVEDMRSANEEAAAETGHVWLIVPQEDRQSCRVIVSTTEGLKEVKTLSELLRGLQQLGEVEKPDLSDWPQSAVFPLG